MTVSHRFTVVLSLVIGAALSIPEPAYATGSNRKMPREAHESCTPQFDQAPKLKRGRAPIFPASKSLKNEGGYAVVEYDIGANGKVSQVRVLDTDYVYFGNHAINAMSKWKFRPARRDGEAIAVTCRMQWDYGNKLRQDAFGDTPAKPQERRALRASHSDGSVQQVILVNSVQPTYPAQALRVCLEGRVELGFVILEDGTTDNLRVLSAQPRGVFERTTLEAVTQWVFRPIMKDGAPARQAATQMVEYTLPTGANCPTREEDRSGQ